MINIVYDILRERYGDDIEPVACIKCAFFLEVGVNSSFQRSLLSFSY